MATVGILGAGASWAVAGCGPAADYSCEGLLTCPADGGISDTSDATAANDAVAPDASLGDAVVEANTDAAAMDGPGSDGFDGFDGFVCDPNKTPSEEACVISNDLGVFVSPSGSDGNPGTELAPVATLGHAMDRAKAAGKRVYACAGTYAEALVVGGARDGVKVYGGLDCTSWSYASANRVVVAPAQPGVALSVSGLQAGVTFSDVEFDGRDANPANPGESSVAVLVSSSAGVVFERVRMVAGRGAAGAAGASAGPNLDGGVSADPTNWFGTPPAYAELNGANATVADAGTATSCTCHDGTTSTGGQGGGATALGQQPGPGSPSYGVDGGGGAGTNGTPCGAGSTTSDGVSAPATSADTPSTALGALSSAGWTPAAGTEGANGKPGQGGGGGGDGKNSMGFGGGGACGGCGGAGGRAGSGGGASIALASVQSSVTLTQCTLAAGVAGGGGAGGAGEAGQTGGGGGSQTNFGCPGGAGGNGSGGNGGQGGPGGPSLGIAYLGTAPTVDGVAVTASATLAGVTVAATKASGGQGGAGGAATGLPAGTGGAAGAVGVAQAVMSF